ncbi:hypothetical protein ACKLNQ_15680, partial [Myroides odoratimimus]
STDGIIVVGDAATGTNSAPNAVLAATTLSIKNASITGEKIQDSSIHGNKIIARTIVGGHIAAGAINGNEHIAAKTITGGNIADGTIGGGHITAKTITGGNIADGTIGTGKLGISRPNAVLITDDKGVPGFDDISKVIPVIQATNGLLKTPGNFIELGGTLTRPTTIATSPSNQLMVTGLPTANNKTDNVVMVDASTGALRQTNAVNPSYFYLPPVNITVTPGATNQSLNIYNLYSTQYKNPRAKSNSAASLPVYNATELNYFIIYADPAVFSNIAVDAYGVMTYSISSSPNVTGSTFITVVLQTK